MDRSEVVKISIVIILGYMSSFMSIMKLRVPAFSP